MSKSPTRMMLRSLVKKFKSHSLNEDAPTDGQQLSPTGDVPTTLALEASQLTDGIESTIATPPSSETPTAPNTLQLANRYDIRQYAPPATMPSRQHHHHLRSSAGCGCNSNTVSSIATRLRSSMVGAGVGAGAGVGVGVGPGAGIVPGAGIGGGHHGHCNKMCTHRRSSQVGPRYHCGQGSKAGANDGNNDDDCCKDSGTESDDEELERIETNSTHSVPVSQTSDYYASQQSLSINSCRSSHCSSPLLGLSDQECNSWESIGSESGIGSVRTTGSCQHHMKHQAGCRANTGLIMSTTATTFMRPPSELMMREELPQHHYHTRQQFHRLTQQISMKNGLIGGNEEKFEEELDDQPTAFVPVRPLATLEQSPEGAGGGSSSLDELEEVNFGQQQMKNRRARAATVSVLGSSEKRKWSQIRQEQRRQPISMGGDMRGGEEEKKMKERPVLQAARKTPIKLLFSSDGRAGSGRCQIHNQQLPQQGNVSPPAGSVAKKLRSMRKKCKCDDDEGADRCPKEEEDDDDEEDNACAAKRPSLDFNKMREKLVGIGAIGGGNKKQKRSGGLINCSGMKAKLKSMGGRREGYQLRSTHRQCCLFRPLKPPASSSTTTQEASSLEMSEQAASAWIPAEVNEQEEVLPSWQQGLSGTFYFGSTTSSE